MSPAPTAATITSVATSQFDRRLHQRYPITLEVEYKLLDGTSVHRQGFCRTVNISSHGVLLNLQDILPTRSSIELSIKWPFPLGGSVPLKLKVRGKIVRADDNSTAVEVIKSEFHTSGHDQLNKRR